MMGLLAVVSFFMKIVLVLWVFISIALILVVLIQKGKGGGVGAAFGGSGAGSLLGTKTGDWLTKVTIVIVLLFLLLAVVLDKYYRAGISKQDWGETKTDQPMPPQGPADAGDAAVDTSGTAAPQPLPSGRPAGPVQPPQPPQPSAPAAPQGQQPQK